jgi:enoyl-CoA hydratase/carnithine racemase
MNNLLQVSKTSDIAVFTINNPPVNALSDELRESIRETFERIENDESGHNSPVPKSIDQVVSIYKT